MELKKAKLDNPNTGKFEELHEDARRRNQRKEERGYE